MSLLEDSDTALGEDAIETGLDWTEIDGDASDLLDSCFGVSMRWFWKFVIFEEIEVSIEFQGLNSLTLFDAKNSKFFFIFQRNNASLFCVLSNS